MPDVDYTQPLKNNKHERFCQEYVIDNNATQAAKRAEYSEKTAYSQGQRLLKNVEVSSRLTVLKAEQAEKAGITAERIVKEIKTIALARLSKTITARNKLTGLDMLGRHCGIFKKDNEQKGLNLADIAALAGVGEK